MNLSPNTPLTAVQGSADVLPTAAADAPGPVVVVVAPAGLTDELRRYLELKRDTLIAELRAIDRMLGRPQTVPVRER